MVKKNVFTFVIMKHVSIQQFGTIFHSREEAQLIVNSLNNEAADLDFEGVSYMSRSFADELLVALKNKHVSFKMTNANTQIAEIFEAVSHTQTKKRFTPDSGEVLQFSSVDSLVAYLSAI